MLLPAPSPLVGESWGGGKVAQRASITRATTSRGGGSQAAR